MNRSAIALLDALAAAMPDDERLILCGFHGNPATIGPRAWSPEPWRPGRRIPFAPTDNAYVAVSSFGRAADGTYRRRVDTFRAGLALMVDDVGTKVPVAKVQTLPPTLRIETSPDNEQWWYLLAEPERDVSQFDALIRAFIAGNLLGEDPGMGGVNRVGRLPGFTNGKPAHNGFRTRVVAADYARRFTPDDLIAHFGLKLRGRRFFAAPARGSEELIERVRSFEITARQLREMGAMKRSDFDPSGWVEIHCPWVDEHSGRADTGAAVRRPSDENGWYGAFRCHHGHCADRGWGDLTDWLDAQNEAALSGDAAA